MQFFRIWTPDRSMPPDGGVVRQSWRGSYFENSKAQRSAARKKAAE
jgi:hypothetical protein